MKQCCGDRRCFEDDHFYACDLFVQPTYCYMTSDCACKACDPYADAYIHEIKPLKDERDKLLLEVARLREAYTRVKIRLEEALGPPGG